MKRPNINQSAQNRPTASIILLALLLTLFFYEISLSSRALAIFFDRWALVPVQLLVSGSAELFTPVSALFIHGGTIHLIGNLLFLWFIGRQVEFRLGSLRYIAFYLVCGVAAALMQVLAEPTSPVAIIGASGATAATIGAWYKHIVGQDFPQNYPNHDYHFPQSHLPVILVVAFWFLIQFFNGVTQVGQTQMQTGGVAFFSHIGGFVAGIVLFRLFLNDRTAKLFNQPPNFPTQ